MNKSRNRILAASAIAVLVALAVGEREEASGALVLTVETDKDVYEIGQPVRIIFDAYNSGDLPVLFGPSQPELAGILVFENAGGLQRSELLAGSDALGRLGIPGSGVVRPGETCQLTTTWLQQLNGYQVAEGQYAFVPVPDSLGPPCDCTGAFAQITIVPEPGTLCLFATAGAACLLRGARRRR
jgi:hypothetical protein